MDATSSIVVRYYDTEVPVAVDVPAARDDMLVQQYHATVRQQLPSDMRKNHPAPVYRVRLLRLNPATNDEDHLSKLYLIHSPTARRLSHRTASSESAMSSITRALRPSFSSEDLWSGTSLTKWPMSLHAIASTFLSDSQSFPRISASFRGSSFCLSSRILLAFSRQNVALRCGGDHRRCPELTSSAYSSKVVWFLVYSSSILRSASRSWRRSGSVICRPARLLMRPGRRAVVAAGINVSGFVDNKLWSVASSNLVVFSFGDTRSRATYKGTTSWSLSERQICRIFCCQRCLTFQVRSPPFFLRN